MRQYPCNSNSLQRAQFGGVEGRESWRAGMPRGRRIQAVNTLPEGLLFWVCPGLMISLADQILSLSPST